MKQYLLLSSNIAIENIYFFYLIIIHFIFLRNLINQFYWKFKIFLLFYFKKNIKRVQPKGYRFRKPYKPDTSKERIPFRYYPFSLVIFISISVYKALIWQKKNESMEIITVSQTWYFCWFEANSESC